MSKPQKKDVAEHLLAAGALVIYLDPRRPGIGGVPDDLRTGSKLVLTGSSDQAVQVDDGGITLTHDFHRATSVVRLPWGAVFALTDENGQGIVWDEDVPTEVRSHRS